MNSTECEICPHKCKIKDGGIGFCRARGNIGGEVRAINYGLVTSLCLDPIEKKPLYHFHPGSYVLSAGSFGCNLRCPHCQNHSISMCGIKESGYEYIDPEKLVHYGEATRSRGNIGIAYTYNEPLVGFEYVLDCAKLAKDKGLKNVVVSNGYVCTKPLLELLQYADAFNIDLKAFSEDFYSKIGGDLKTVCETIKTIAKHAHIEVTTLIIPGMNDSEMEIEELAKWLAGIDSDIPLHLSRFFPRYKLTDIAATDVRVIYKLADIARNYLKHVHEGNC